MMNNEMIAIAVSIFALVASAASAYYAKLALERSDLANRLAESSVKFQVLWPTLNDYMSTDMYVAIGHLWSFYTKDPATLKDRYKQQREADQKAASSLQGEEYSNFIKNTLDHHRRRVGQFYGLLKAIHDEGGEQRRWIYTYWSRRELEILPSIIIPLEEALGEMIGTPASTMSNERLQRLYDDCPKIT